MIRSPAEHLRYRPQLDGLRAVAVAAVAWSHWERPYQFGIPFGAGVHLFYVLSGFLITGILLEVRDEHHRLGAVRAFYVRRALRIFPAFYVTLLLAWCADVPPLRDTLPWHAFYLSNVQIFLTDAWPGAISHLWSLAVEEQFYLVWPWLIVFAPRRWLLPAVLSAVAFAPLFRSLLAVDGHRETMLAVLTPGSLDSLGVGALLALSAVSPAVAATLTRQGRSLAVIAAIAWAALLSVEGRGVGLPLPLMAIKQTLQAVMFAWLVWRAADGFGGVAGRILSAVPIVYVGRISYGVYLVHGFAGIILGAVGISSSATPEPWRFILLSGLTIGIAAVSWHVMERPINRLKVHFPYEAARQTPRAALVPGDA